MALLWAGIIPARGVELIGSTSVNVTSETSASAKDMAFNQARRQIINDALRQYVVVEQLKTAVSKASNSELTNLIASSSIDGERISDTTYTANITMTLDDVAVRKWMADRGVQNWLGQAISGGDNAIVVVTLNDAMGDWIRLNQIARDANIDLGTRFISGHTVTLEMPAASRNAFINSLGAAGWRYSSADGILRVWR